MSKSSGFKFVDMVANPPEIRISPTGARWFLRYRPVLNSQKDVFSVRICPSASEDHILSKKALEGFQRLHLRGQKPALGCVNPLDLPLIPLASVLSAFSPQRQCFAPSPRRPSREYKRMVLEHTHGLFIT